MQTNMPAICPVCYHRSDPRSCTAVTFCIVWGLFCLMYIELVLLCFLTLYWPAYDSSFLQKCCVLPLLWHEVNCHTGAVVSQCHRPSLRLHWLPIRQRFIYKLSVLTYKALHAGQPCYLADLIHSYEPSRCLRSTNGHLLAVPSCVKSSFASRAFCVSSPNNWNSLPAHIRSSDSLVTFQSHLKCHLFSSAYHI